jgi:hypothetical protein
MVRACFEFFTEAIFESFLFHKAPGTRRIVVLCNELQAPYGAKRAKKSESENFKTSS